MPTFEFGEQTDALSRILGNQVPITLGRSPLLETQNNEFLELMLGESIERRHIADRHVWVMSGGGAKGAFQLGAAFALFLDPRLRPSAIASTSIGSINAIKLAEDGFDPVMGLSRVWFGVRHRSEVYTRAAWPRYLSEVFLGTGLPIGDLFRGIETFLGGGSDTPFETEFSPSVVAFINSFLRQIVDGVSAASNATAMFGAAVPVIGGIVGSIMAKDRAEAEVQELRAALTELVRVVSGEYGPEEARKFADGLFEFHPLTRQITANVDEERVAASSIPIRLVSVGAHSGSIFHVLKSGAVEILARDGEAPVRPVPFGVIDSVRPSWDAVVMGCLASASVPVFNRPISLDVLPSGGGNTVRLSLVDGGVREVLPVEAGLNTIADLGASPADVGMIGIALGTSYQPQEDLLVEELRRPVNRDKAPTLFDMLGLTFESFADEVVRNEHDYFRKELSEVRSRLLIAPSASIGGLAEIDPGLVQIQTAYGYMTAFDVMWSRNLGLTPERYREGPWRSTNLIIQKRFVCWLLEGKGLPFFHELSVEAASDGARAPIPIKSGPDGYLFDFDGLGARLSQLTTPDDLDFALSKLARIRELKLEVRDHLIERLETWGPESVPSPLELSLDQTNVNTIVDWFRRFERHGVNATSGYPTGPGTVRVRDGASVPSALAGAPQRLAFDELWRGAATPFHAQATLGSLGESPSFNFVEQTEAMTVSETILERSPDYVVVRLEGHVFRSDEAIEGLVEIRHSFARIASGASDNRLLRFDELPGEGRHEGFVLHPDRAPPADPAFVPLVRWFDSVGFDTLCTTDPRLLSETGTPLDTVWGRYREPKVLGFVLSPYTRTLPAETVPLWRWYSVDRNDHDTSSHESWQFPMPTAGTGVFVGQV